jgi:hypothetical protein
VWQRIATDTDSGSDVEVTYSARAKDVVSMLAYRGTSASEPIAAFQGAGETTSRAGHETPVVPLTRNGTWALSYWADNSSATTGWSLPGNVTTRSTACGSGGGHVCAVVADSNGPVAGSEYGGLVATADSASAKAVMWTLLLRPS